MKPENGEIWIHDLEDEGVMQITGDGSTFGTTVGKGPERPLSQLSNLG